MRPKIKYHIIYRHRDEYPVSVICKFFEVSQSGYYAFVKRLGQPEHDTELAEQIRECQKVTDKTYGYRRIWIWQNLGQQVYNYEILLARQFRADKPNAKWVTDISYTHTKEGVLYLSMICDLYDNSIAAYKTATQQTVNLVLDTIRPAIKKEKKRVAAELQLHSDQGFVSTKICKNCSTNFNKNTIQHRSKTIISWYNVQLDKRGTAILCVYDNALRHYPSNGCGCGCGNAHGHGYVPDRHAGVHGCATVRWYLSPSTRLQQS